MRQSCFTFDLQVAACGPVQERMASAVHCNVPNEDLSAAEWAEIEARMRSDTLFCKHGMLVDPDSIADSGDTAGAAAAASDESLAAVLARDHATLHRLGVTALQAAAAMAYLAYHIEYADCDKEMDVSVYPNMRAVHACPDPNNQRHGHPPTVRVGKMPVTGSNVFTTHLIFMGAQGCPFQNRALDSKGHGMQYGSADYVFENEQGQRLQFCTLLVHMIAKHGFFEGPRLRDGSPNPWRVDPESACAFLQPILSIVTKLSDDELQKRFLANYV